MVWISPLCRLVFAAATAILTAQNGVGLEGLLTAEPVSIDIGVSFCCNVEKLEGCTLPKVVAAVNELVDPSVEASFFGDLALTEPIGTPVQVYFISLTKEKQC